MTEDERDAVDTDEQEGLVVDQLPRALYRVRLDSGVEITAHRSGSPRRNFMRLLEGDRVAVRVTARDRTRGRIVERR